MPRLRTMHETDGQAAEPENALEVLPARMDAVVMRIDGLVLEFSELRHALGSLLSRDIQTEELAEARRALALPAESVERKLQRRRTEDEMRYALRLLSSGQPRPRDDDSIQVLEDAIVEVFALRQLNMDLMQRMSTAYQDGIAAIRALTSR